MKKKTKEDNPDEIENYVEIMRFMRRKFKKGLRTIDINSFKELVDRYLDLQENNTDEIVAFKKYFDLKQEPRKKIGIFKMSVYTNNVLWGLEKYIEEIY